jgi:hypothetical protein
MPRAVATATEATKNDVTRDVRACISVDSLTLDLLEKIGRKYQVNKSAAANTVIDLYLAKSKVNSELLVAFHQEIWLKAVHQEGRYASARFDLTEVENDALFVIARTLFGNSNRSKALRVLVAYFAIEYKLAETHYQGFVIRPIG